MHPILIVDDEVEMRIAMSETLKHCGYPVETSHNAIDAANKLKKADYSMVITDMTMPKKSGIELLREIREMDPVKPVLMVTAYGTIDTAVEAMKLGAFDYILKPFKFDVFTFVVERALAMGEEQRKTSAPPRGTPGAAPPPREDQETGGLEIITGDPDMQNLLGVASNVAKSKSTVLIQSESGTGKELLARFIHDNSDRKTGPFVAVNCAALPDTLLESELFGHRKGSFTGAVAEHKGRFEQAGGGTLLLDEISEMALPLQAKLLRVLQEFVVDPVGSKEPVAVDVRVVATTNRNLFEDVEHGKFREDLYYRLNVIPLQLPPLRERKGDIPLLADYFIKKHTGRNHRQPMGISPKAMEVLCLYNWRGNVRELENVMERAVLLCDRGDILPHHLLMGAAGTRAFNGKPTPAEGPSQTVPAAQKEGASGPAGGSNGKGGNHEKTGGAIGVGMSLRDVEKELIFQTLRASDSNRTQAAKTLGISIRTLRNKLHEYADAGELPDFLSAGDDEGE